MLTGDDPYARQRWLVGWRHPLRALNAMVVRVLGTTPVTVRIDLDDLDDFDDLGDLEYASPNETVRVGPGPRAR